jgi:hypothetical protein
MTGRSCCPAPGRGSAQRWGDGHLAEERTCVSTPLPGAGEGDKKRRSGVSYRVRGRGGKRSRYPSSCPAGHLLPQGEKGEVNRGQGDGRLADTRRVGEARAFLRPVNPRKYAPSPLVGEVPRSGDGGCARCPPRPDPPSALRATSPTRVEDDLLADLTNLRGDRWVGERLRFRHATGARVLL